MIFPYILTVLIFLSSPTKGFGTSAPGYLGVPASKKCLGTKSMGSWTAWCFPFEKPAACTPTSWQELMTLQKDPTQRLPSCAEEQEEEPVITVEAVESGCQCIQKITDTTEHLQKKVEVLENQNSNFQDQLNTLGDRLVKLQILTHSREVCFEDLASSKCEGSESGQVGIVEAIRVDGGWGLFSEWSQCTATCGGGSQVRNRTCNNPEPQLGGKNCIGSGEDGRKCNEEECCPDGMTRVNGECSDCVKENNYDYNGDDIPGGYTNSYSADECAAACGRNDECNFWTYGKYGRQCWMKYANSDRRYNDEVISGNKACGKGSNPDYDDGSGYRSTLDYGY